MSAIRRFRRTGGLVFAVSALVAALWLVLAGAAHTISARTYVLGAPDSAVVTTLEQSKQVCQASIATRHPFREVAVFGRPVTGSGEILVTVRRRVSSRILASGFVAVGGQGQQTAVLNRTVDTREPLEVCIRATLHAFSVFGSSPVRQDVHVLGDKHAEFSLVLIDPRRSVLSLLPAAFDHASVFKLSWMGGWTFWVLLGLLVMTIGIGTVAVVSAEGEDELVADATPVFVDATPSSGTEAGMQDPRRSDVSS